MMSYDYHGPWDTTVKGANLTVLPQTSLQDIKDSVLLYTCVGIDMRKVNLGLAWYGCSYALADKNCNSYGCLMTGGGAKGECTNATGMLSYLEITWLIGSNTVHYDKDSKTKWFKNSSDLITYDDEETWKAKKEFADNTCFGGTMVWSMDQVDPSEAPQNTGNPCTDAKTWAKDYVELEMSDFFTEYTAPIPQPMGPPAQGGCGCYYDTSNIWQQVTAMEGVINYMLLTGDNQFKDDITSFGAAFTDGSFSYLLGPAAFSNSHDDALWTVLLYFKIDEWLEKIEDPDECFWDAGIKLLKWVGEGQTDDDQGGTTSACDSVWWEDTASSNKPYKNAITNELFIVASTEAYLKTKEKSYLNNALATWNFSKDKMQHGAGNSQEGLFSNGTSLPDCTNNNQETWTYNQGVILHGLRLLYKATGDHSYIDEALVMLDAAHKFKVKEGTDILAEGCDISGTCNVNQVGFKGLFMQHLQYFLEVVNDPKITAKYSDWIGLQAQAVNQYACQSDGHLGSIWWGTSDAAIYPNAVNAFSSGLDTILAPYEFGTC
ncbi:hypothetical protein CTheo_4992 [Ceratobasidium theobromae]|uniref:GH18 domain-containing protein n=1 Tax=Ceratobasidium theobromae TaxID=1582974 RepID=A0A5N5QJ59_9AGAM|nr:hypothetical protein CTheo_4992 [Ceratobasidium theobromae]